MSVWVRFGVNAALVGGDFSSLVCDFDGFVIGIDEVDCEGIGAERVTNIANSQERCFTGVMSKG